MSTVTTHIKTEKQLVPALRFKEFEDEWKYFKLADIVDKKISYGIVQAGEHIEGGMPYIKSKDINGPIILDTLERTSDEIAKKYIRSEVTPGDIIFSLRGNIGISQILPESIKVANLTQGTARISVSDNYANYFVYQSLHTLPVIKRILSVSKGSTFQEISLADLRNVKIVSPFFPEQQKIASFLSAVDEKIQQLTAKKSLLEQYKKGVMQKLFSGKIRFKDENGNDFPDWEEKTLSDVASFRRGSFPQPYGLPKWYDDNGAPFVQVYDVAKNMRLKTKTKQYISEAAQKQSVFVKKGTLVLTIQGSIGRLAKTQYDAYVDRTLLIFQSYKVELDIDYFKYVVYLLFEIEKTKAPGGTIKTITKEKLSSFTVNIPKLEEQQKIATYLSSLDTKIETVNKRITQTQTFKKGLLQQMFV